MSNKKKESDLIGNILLDETTDSNDLDLIEQNRQAFINNRSTSAPPPGLSDTNFAEASQKGDVVASQEYYWYYFSIKPVDPRLPKPLWKPHMWQGENRDLTLAQKVDGQTEDEHEAKVARKGSMPMPEKTSLNDLSTQMNQSLSLSQNDSPDSLTKFQNQDRQGQQHYGQQQNQNFNQNFQKPRNQNQNQYQRPQNQGQGPNQQGQSQGQNQGQNQNFGNNFQQQGQFQGQTTNFFQQQEMMPNYQKPYANQGYNAFPQQQFQQSPNFYPQMNYQPNMNMFGQNFPINDPNQFMIQNDPMGMQRFPNQYPNYYPQYGYQNFNQNQGNMGGMGGNMQGMNQMRMNNNFSNGGANNKNFYPNNMQKDKGYQRGAPGSAGFKNQNQGMQHNNQGHQTPKLDIKQVLQKIVENCQDQNGSRLIQQHFENTTQEERDQIFEKIKPEALKLMTDVFGNYVIQKILEKGTIEQKLALFDALKGEVFNLSVHTYGCRVVQKALEEFKGNNTIQDKIIGELKDRVLECIEDQNGNHVIQKMFETISSEKLQFIIDVVIDNLQKLAFHAYGCRVIQRILENAPSDRTAPIMKKLMENCVKLCECQYGNYIMQHILEKGPQNEKQQLLNVIRSNFVGLSLNKFASNVTEKSALFGSMDFRREVLEVLLAPTQNDAPGLLQLMTHQFGNYVIQRLFECSDHSIRTKLYAKIKTYDANELRKSQFGKHVLSFMEKLMDDTQKNF